jgi:hypothetical protein
MFELTVTTPCRHLAPAVGFDQLDGVADLWHDDILPWCDAGIRRGENSAPAVHSPAT